MLVEKDDFLRIHQKKRLFQLIKKIRYVELLKLIHGIKTHSPNLGKLFKRKNYCLLKNRNKNTWPRKFVKDQNDLTIKGTKRQNFLDPIP